MKSAANSLVQSFLFLIAVTTPVIAFAHEESSPPLYPSEKIYSPTPLPDRVTLTWEDDTTTTQSVTWRTDTTVNRGVAQLALANANGRALRPKSHEANTSALTTGDRVAHFHTVTFKNLQPGTLYTYRVGDGTNWTEYFHFRTASEYRAPFSFIYFGDAQNEVRTHWSRVFREAFRDAPRAALTLHAGDLVNVHDRDSEWGEWQHGPSWVNATIPVIATPGNHEYYTINSGPRSERSWSTKSGDRIEVKMTAYSESPSDSGTQYTVSFQGPDSVEATLTIGDGGQILFASDAVTALTGYDPTELIGTSFYNHPLKDQQRAPGNPAVTPHWAHQFTFPTQNIPHPALSETLYYIDYQGTRFISLDSNQLPDLQIDWLRNVLTDNPNKWTVITFHHPIFSPASDRDNATLRSQWKPIFDEFKVDLVLNGHDHTYARTGDLGDQIKEKNSFEGYQQAYDPEVGTVYVVSVSGPKMYEITKDRYAKRMAENTQLYQVISIDGDVLDFRAYKATGELFDHFSLEKRENAPNKLVETIR